MLFTSRYMLPKWNTLCKDIACPRYGESVLYWTWLFRRAGCHVARTKFGGNRKVVLAWFASPVDLGRSDVTDIVLQCTNETRGFFANDNNSSPKTSTHNKAKEFFDSNLFPPMFFYFISLFSSPIFVKIGIYIYEFHCNLSANDIASCPRVCTYTL